jgi:hypothetical protein
MKPDVVKSVASLIPIEALLSPENTPTTCGGVTNIEEVSVLPSRILYLLRWGYLLSFQV